MADFLVTIIESVVVSGSDAHDEAEAIQVAMDGGGVLVAKTTQTEEVYRHQRTFGHRRSNPVDPN